jgi:hypothetical protein
LSGFGEASYIYSTQTVAPNIIVGRLYDRYSNAFTVNALKLTADLPFDPKKVSAGVHGDVLIGQNAEVIHSTGPSNGTAGSFNLGLDGDIEQVYVTLNLPTGNGVQFKIGKMVSLMGLEVIEDVANPVWSLGNQFIYVENFTSTGVEMDFKPSAATDVELRVDNGWDRVTVPDGQKSFMGRLGISGAKTTLGIVGYWGEMESGISAARYGLDVLLNQKMGKASIWIQGDYGKEAANAALFDPTQDASWWAVAGWLAVDVSPTLNLSGRADYLDDTQSARTGFTFGVPLPGAAHKLWSLTGDLNVKTWANVLVRPEVRYDHSSFTVFNGKGDQLSVALSAAYSF